MNSIRTLSAFKILIFRRRGHSVTTCNSLGLHCTIRCTSILATHGIAFHYHFTNLGKLPKNIKSQSKNSSGNSDLTLTKLRGAIQKRVTKSVSDKIKLVYISKCRLYWIRGGGGFSDFSQIQKTETWPWFWWYMGLILVRYMQHRVYIWPIYD